MGTNGGNFIACKASGVPPQFPTIADRLKEQGYATHMIGKQEVEKLSIGTRRETAMPNLAFFKKIVYEVAVSVCC